MFHFDFSLPLKDPVLIFSLVLLIILLAPIILAKLKIPSLVGLILAGVLFGPHGLNILQRDSSIILFGTVGLLYIMFLAALELDLNQLQKNKYRGLLFGALTFFFPFLLGITVCRYILGFNPTASILVASMFSTHTLVAYPVVSHLGIVKNSAVLITIAGTVITDVLVLLILAVIAGSQTEGLNSVYWVHFGISIILFCGVVFGIFPLFARWFFRYLEGEKSSHFIFVLFLVFLAAFLAKLAGIEPIIGAFAAGLTLNRLIPQTSPLMNRLEFVGNALFIPFFLIGVGMLVDLKVLLRGPEALLTALLLTVGAIGGKWLAALATQKIFKYTPEERNLIFGLSSSHAAATLAVILVGFNLGLINENVLNGTIILILVSCLIGTFVTEKAGRRLVIIEGQKQPPLLEKHQSILVPIANPLAIESLLDFAIMIKNPKSHLPISMLTVVQDNEEATARVIENKKMFEKAVTHASATDTKVEVLLRVDLNITSGIIRAGKELGTTDIIIGWTGQSKATASIFGTTLDNLLKSTWQTIFVCRIMEPISFSKKIVVLVPPSAEFELGFGHWVNILGRLSGQVGTKMIFVCSVYTEKVIKQAIKDGHSSVHVSYENFNEWDDFHAFTQKVGKEDLAVLISSRDGGISHNSYLDHLPSKLANHPQINNFVVIYPEQELRNFWTPAFETVL